MPATSTVVGGLLGFGVQLYVNGVRKLPLFRNPWEHAAWAAAGAAFGAWVVRFEDATERELAVMLQKREEANANLRR